MLDTGDALKALLDCIVEKYPNDLDGHSLVPFGASLSNCCTENGFLGLSEVGQHPSKRPTPEFVATLRNSDNPMQTTVSGLLRFAQCASVSPDGNFIYDSETEQQNEAVRSNRRNQMYSALACCLKTTVEWCGKTHTVRGFFTEPMYNVEVSGGCTIAEYPFYLEACWHDCE